MPISATTILAFVAAAAAKVAPRNPKIAELEAKIDDLKSRLRGARPRGGSMAASGSRS